MIISKYLYEELVKYKEEKAFKKGMIAALASLQNEFIFISPNKTFTKNEIISLIEEEKKKI